MSELKENGEWRFIDNGEQEGAFNMAVDEALARAENLSTPVLRFFAWKPHAISVGYHQNISEVDLEKCEKRGIAVVRRPTGGRAIFHAEEVTYSVTIPKAHRLFQMRNEALYNIIGQALVKGLARLSPEIVLQRASLASSDFARYSHKFACFATSARHEIMHSSRKLVGSAQRRYDTSVLQHGSIILGDLHLDLVRFIRSEGRDIQNAMAALRAKTTSLSEIVGRAVFYAELVEPLKRAFEEVFGVRLVKSQLGSDELETVDRLKSKFIN